MPPRKKAKASAASTPLADSQPKTPQESGAAAQSQDLTSLQDENLLGDTWTDDQETQLFKSMMRWKPTGLHKHFRMISIHNNMRSHGFATEDAPHTRIPGVWRKLHQLYDLRALDEREDAYTFHELPDPNDRAESYDIPPFELPEDEFGELMWQKRFHGPGSVVSSSPPLIPVEEDKLLYMPGFGLLKDLPNGVRTQKAESVVEATPTPKNTKTTRTSRAAAKSGKGTKAGQAEKKNSKAPSAVSESTNEDDEDEEEEEESSSESEEETAPSTRRTNRSVGKAKQAAPKRTRKR